MEIVGLTLLVIAGGFFFYSVFKGKKQKEDGEADIPTAKKEKTKGKSKAKKDETVQDLLEFDEITERGIVRLKNGTYTATLEIAQINQYLNNIQENAAIWKKYRTMLNSISVRHTELIQSQYLDVSDFISDYNAKSEELQNLTPELEAARDDVIENYRYFSEQKTREYRAYIILRFNPKKDNAEKGLETGNSVIDNLLSMSKNTMDEEEERELAESMLDEVIDLTYQMLYSIGSQAVRLNRQGVLAMTYATLNRDLALVQRINDASNAHSFTEFKQSTSAYLFEQQLLNEIDGVSADDVPFRYEDFENDSIENTNLNGDLTEDEKKVLQTSY